MKALVFVPDYGTDSLTVAEVLTAIRNFTNTAFTTDVIASRPFNTIHAGFLLDQIQRQLSEDRAKETIFFLNTDPRTQTANPIEKAEGSELYVAWLENGATVISPKAGYCFSFIKTKIKKFARLKVLANGSQFRSRDIFPAMVSKVLDNNLKDENFTETKIEEIPDLPLDFFVIHIDNYGNIKTSFTQNDLEKTGLKWGDWINIKIGNKDTLHTKDTLRTKVASTIFTCEPGTLVFAPGSSGDKNNPYLELSVRFNGNYNNASAGDLFENPEPGSVIKIIL